MPPRALRVGCSFEIEAVLERIPRDREREPTAAAFTLSLVLRPG
jgi:hypothetical protein